MIPQTTVDEYFRVQWAIWTLEAKKKKLEAELLAALAAGAPIPRHGQFWLERVIRKRRPIRWKLVAKQLADTTRSKRKLREILASVPEREVAELYVGGYDGRSRR